MKPPKRVQLKVGEFYTVQGAAKALGLSYWTVYRYVRVAGIPTRQLSNLTLVRLEDLRELGDPLAEEQAPGEADACDDEPPEMPDTRPVADTPHPYEMGPLPDMAESVQEAARPTRRRLVRIREIDRPFRSRQARKHL